MRYFLRNFQLTLDKLDIYQNFQLTLDKLDIYQPNKHSIKLNIKD